MTKCLVVRADDTASLMDVNGLQEYQRIVGGWIEGVSGGKCWAYCNEEGKLEGLPVNFVATKLARKLGWPVGDVLCGDVVFNGGPDSKGDDTDITEAQLAVAREFIIGL